MGNGNPNGMIEVKAKTNNGGASEGKILWRVPNSVLHDFRTKLLTNNGWNGNIEPFEICIRTQKAEPYVLLLLNLKTEIDVLAPTYLFPKGVRSSNPTILTKMHEMLENYQLATDTLNAICREENLPPISFAPIDQRLLEKPTNDSAKAAIDAFVERQTGHFSRELKGATNLPEILGALNKVARIYLETNGCLSTSKLTESFGQPHVAAIHNAEKLKIIEIQLSHGIVIDIEYTDTSKPVIFFIGNIHERHEKLQRHALATGYNVHEAGQHKIFGDLGKTATPKEKTAHP